MLAGYLRDRPLIKTTAELKPEHSEPGRKVIFILFDALREDFVEWPDGNPPYLQSDAPYSFTGKKVTLFNRLVQEEPLNSFLAPLRSEMPTVTVSRVKTFLSGVIGTVVDFSEFIGEGTFAEDNILVSLHKKFKDNTSIKFFGDEVWVTRFGKWFTKEVSLPDLDVRELDRNDNLASENIYAELDNGSDF